MYLNNAYKLKETINKSKKHHVDMYNVLNRIGSENDAIVLAVCVVDFDIKLPRPVEVVDLRMYNS